MNHSRLKQLFKFLEEDPHDPFNLYAIANEYISIDKGESLKYFEKLLSEHKGYLPTYYQAATLYSNMGKTQKATEIFEAGIQLAKQQNNLKTLRELQNALDELIMDED